MAKKILVHGDLCLSQAGWYVLAGRSRGRREEEYLEALYILWKRDGAIRVKGLAEILSVKPPSIVEYLDRLARKGLVKYVRHEVITLTDKGIELAEGIYRRHTALKDFLTMFLRLPEDVAEEDACSIEHELHEVTVRRVMRVVDYFKRKPEEMEKLLDLLSNAYRGD